MFFDMRVADIELVARAVLPKFFSNNLQPETWRVFSCAADDVCSL